MTFSDVRREFRAEYLRWLGHQTEHAMKMGYPISIISRSSARQTALSMIRAKREHAGFRQVIAEAINSLDHMSGGAA